MKTKEELNVIKEEVETMKKKLAELTVEELKQVAGGFVVIMTTMECENCGYGTIWGGSYAGYYDCPECGKHTLHNV